jgi:hypothetical protein
VERLEGYVVDIAPRPLRGTPGGDHVTRSEVESSVAWEAGFRPRPGGPMVAGDPWG